MKHLLKSFAMAVTTMATIFTLNTPSAYAVATLRLSDGTTTQTIADGSGADSSVDPGVVGFSGGIGNFSLNITTGQSKPAKGSDLLPLLDITSFNSTTLGNGGGTLTLEFTDTDFSPNGFLDFFSGFDGGTEGTVRLETFLGTGNMPFEQTVPLTDSGLLTRPPIVFSDMDVLNNVNTSMSNYSLTLRVTVAHSAANQNTSFDAELKGELPSMAVPEPVTSVLGLMSLGVLGMATRRRAAKSVSP